MAIPRVPLNVDPSGYAGGLLRGIPIGGGGGGGAPGLLPGVGNLLERMMGLKEKFAQAQLNQMYQQLAAARQQQQWAASAQRRAAEEARKPTEEQLARRERERERRREEHKGVLFAEAMTESPTYSAMGQRPGLIKMLQAIGPQAAHQGMIESGRVLGQMGAAVAGAQGRGGAGGEAAPTPSPYRVVHGAGFETVEPGMYAGEGGGYTGFDPSRYQGRGGLQGLGRRRRAYKRGGTIPSTGTYKLHKGELVIPAGDVDKNSDLVTQLVHRKLTERIRIKPKGSYQAGTIQGELIGKAMEGDIPSFREILRAAGVSELEIDLTINGVTRERGGQTTSKANKIQRIKDYFSGALAPYAGGPGVPGAGEITEPRLLGGQKLLGPGRTIFGHPPPTHIPGPTTARTVAEIVEEAMPKAAKAAAKGGGRGKAIAAGIGIPAALAGIYMLARQGGKATKAPERDLWPWWALAAGAPGRWAAKVGEGRGAGVAAGEAIREQFAGLAGAPRALGEKLGETGFMQGLVGPGEELFGVGAKPAPKEEEDEKIKELIAALGAGAPGEAEPAEGTYEAASARVRAGDYGTPEQPLVLRGKLSDIEQAQREVESIPAYREAQEKTRRMEQEAERIFTMLEREGPLLDPQVYADLYQEGQRKMALGDRFRQITERREKANEAFMTSTAKALNQLTRDVALEKTKIGGRMELEELKQQGRLSSTQLRGFAEALPRLYGVTATGTPQERTRAKQQIASILLFLAPELQPGAQLTPENAAAMADRFSNLTGDEAQALTQALLAKLGGGGTE